MKIANLRKCWKTNSFPNSLHSRKLLNSFFIVPRVLGIFPFNERFELSLNHSLYHMVFYFIISTFGLYTMPISSLIQIWETNLWYFVDYFTMNACVFSAVWYLASNKDKVVYVISAIELAENETASIQPIWHYWPNKFRFYFNLILFCITVFIQGLMCVYYLGYSTAISLFSFCSVSLLDIVVMLQYNAFIFVLTSSFSRILSLGDPLTVVKYHEKLCSATSCVSDLYGPGLFFLYADCFYCVVWNIFFVAKLDVLFAMRVVRCLWTLSNITRILEVIHISNLLKDEVIFIQISTIFFSFVHILFRASTAALRWVPSILSILFKYETI